MRDDLFVTSLSIMWDGVDDPDEYPFAIPAIASVSTLEFSSPITFFCGENGTGKSTLLEAMSIAYGLNPEGGSKNHLYSVNDVHSRLCDHLKLARSIYRPDDSFLVRSDTMFNLITEMDKLDDDARYFEGRSLHRRSHGEGMLALISRRFGERGFYVLDEPESGLSQCGQIALLAQIVKLARAGSQFVIATHSPILMTAPDAVVYQFDTEVSAVEPDQTMEWVMLHRFLENPERELAYFMED